MELDSVAKLRRAFFRLMGTEDDDPELDRRGEASNEVVDMALTAGVRAAQRWMLSVGYAGWRATETLAFSDAADGRGQVASLPDDFLRAYGRMGRTRRSALVKSNGDRWGQEISAEDDHKQHAVYWIEGDELRVGEKASPPSGLVLDYHYLHPAISDGVTLDFPMEARPLIVAEAAARATDENWVALDAAEVIPKVERALARAKEIARDVARPTKQPRQFRKPVRFGNRW